MFNNLKYGGIDMKKFKKHIMMSAVLLIILVLSVACGQTNPVKQVKKFLTGVQKQDFKSIFDISYYYQTELSQITSNNPKVLWPKLTTEYYESKKNALFRQKKESLTNVWIRFSGEFFGTPTDPVENIRALMDLLAPSPKWKVIESKKEKQFDMWEGRQYDVYVVYVSLNYKTVEESPLIGSKVLKEATLGFVLDAKTGLYMRSSRVEKGDVYWELLPEDEDALDRKKAKAIEDELLKKQHSGI